MKIRSGIVGLAVAVTLVSCERKAEVTPPPETRKVAPATSPITAKPTVAGTAREAGEAGPRATAGVTATPPR